MRSLPSRSHAIAFNCPKKARECPILARSEHQLAASVAASGRLAENVPSPTRLRPASSRRCCAPRLLWGHPALPTQPCPRAMPCPWQLLHAGPRSRRAGTGSARPRRRPARRARPARKSGDKRTGSRSARSEKCAQQAESRRERAAVVGREVHPSSSSSMHSQSRRSGCATRWSLCARGGRRARAARTAKLLVDGKGGPVSSRSRRGLRCPCSPAGAVDRCCWPERAAGSRLGAGAPVSLPPKVDEAAASLSSEYGSMESDTRCRSISMPMMRTSTCPRAHVAVGGLRAREWSQLR